MFYETATMPPHPPPRELLLPQDIPEMHSRGVGQWGGGEDKRSNPSKEWNVSILGGKEFGVHGEYSQNRYPQRELQKDRELQ